MLPLVLRSSASCLEEAIANRLKQVGKQVLDSASFGMVCSSRKVVGDPGERVGGSVCDTIFH